MTSTDTITDAQLEAVAREDIRAAIDNMCCDATTQSEVLDDALGDYYDGDDRDGWDQLRDRYDAIVRKLRDQHFPAQS